MANRSGHPLWHLAQQPDNRIRLAEGALLIAKGAYPALDVSAYLNRLADMGTVLQRLVANASDVNTQLEALNDYLFQQEGFRGAAPDGYYDLRNSYLNHVIERKSGIPITLSVIYIDLAQTIGLPLVGVNFPSHFIVKHKTLDTFIDPFNMGKILTREDLLARLEQTFNQPVQMQPRFLETATNKHILARILRNLKQIYFSLEDYHNAIRVGEQITWLTPDAAQDFRDLGYLYYRVQAYHQSLVAFQRYLQLADNPPDQQEITNHLRTIAAQIASLN